MISDLDIYRSAKLLMNKHGDKAHEEALRRMENYRVKGDNDAMEIWQRLADAVQVLQVPPNTTKTVQ
jgi:hypothetical protein